MKRLLILALLLLFFIPALARENRVIDDSDMLTSAEEAALEARIGEIWDAKQFDVVLVNVADIGSYTPDDFAADFYDYGGFGYGAGHDGILLLLVTGGEVGNRDYTILCTGSAEKIFRDSVLSDIEDDILPYLRRSDFANAERIFVERVARRLDAVTPEGRAARLLPILTIVGLGVGLITVGVMKHGMKSVRKKRGAENYVEDGSFRLHTSQDVYLYTTTTRRKIETSSGPRSGGGGFSGGGFTGHSGTHHTSHSGKF